VSEVGSTGAESAIGDTRGERCLECGRGEIRILQTNEECVGKNDSALTIVLACGYDGGQQQRGAGRNYERRSTHGDISENETLGETNNANSPAVSRSLQITSSALLPHFRPVSIDLLIRLSSLYPPLFFSELHDAFLLWNAVSTLPDIRGHTPRHARERSPHDSNSGQLFVSFSPYL